MRIPIRKYSATSDVLGTEPLSLEIAVLLTNLTTPPCSSHLLGSHTYDISGSRSRFSRSSARFHYFDRGVPFSCRHFTCPSLFTAYTSDKYILSPYPSILSPPSSITSFPLLPALVIFELVQGLVKFQNIIEPKSLESGAEC